MAAETEQWRGLIQSLKRTARGPLALAPQTYMPYARCCLSPSQLHHSALVTKVLTQLPTSEICAVVPGPGTPDGPHAAWSAAPFVHDFSKPSPMSLSVAADDATGQHNLASLSDSLRGPDGSWSRLGWGRYAENRVIYTSDHYVGDARTWHLGVDLEVSSYWFFFLNFLDYKSARVASAETLTCIFFQYKKIGAYRYPGLCAASGNYP
jgi:hypothetical protein